MDLNWIYFRALETPFRVYYLKQSSGKTELPVGSEGECRQQIFKSVRGFTTDGPNVLPNKALNSTLLRKHEQLDNYREKKVWGAVRKSRQANSSSAWGRLGAFSHKELLIFGAL